MSTSNALENFWLKRGEILNYIAFVSGVEPSSSAYVNDSGIAIPIETETRTILKANFFVMYYNLVESAIREVFIEIYEEAISASKSFNDLTRAWRRTAIKSLAYEREAHKDVPSRYYELVIDVAEHVSSGVAIPLKRMALSGNVDNYLIRELAERHGIVFEIPADCRAGTDLHTIKENRNKLAHGNSTFVELGRDYSSDELAKMMHRANTFMEAFIVSAIAYRDDHKFLAPPA